MVRTVLVPIVLAAIVAACGGGSAPPPLPGPVYSPIIANQLRGIAPDCKLERVGETERRNCTGRNGAVQITLGAGSRFTALTVALPAKILPEAKGHFGAALAGLLGPQGIETFLAKLSSLETGQRADLTIGNAKVGISAGGKSTIAPEYTVEMTWF
jgi:hypothetical protein